MNVWHIFLTSTDSHQVDRVVNGSQGGTVFDIADDFRCEAGRSGELVTAVNDTVSDGINFVNAFDDAMVFADQGFNDNLYGCIVIRKIAISFQPLGIGRFVAEVTEFRSDSFAEPLCQDAFIIHFHQTEF